jgi:thiamine-monophosphate kinase
VQEFELIRQIQRDTAVDYPPGFQHGVRLGIGDDAAVLELPPDTHLVAAADTMNAGVHFPEDTAPFDIGYKCLAVNLSDLASMGATPRWALLSLSLPKAEAEWASQFAEGFRSLAQTHRVTLVGGDTTRGPLSISVTVLGFIEPGKQLTRDGANPGDLVVVSGSTGGAAFVLESLQSGRPVADRRRLDRPRPRVRLGQSLKGHASACIDISDGLLADLGHVLKASGCGARLDIGNLPENTLLAACDPERKRRYQLAGGDDYELLFTLPPRHRDWLDKLSASLEVPLTVIGEIEAGKGVRCVTADGSAYQPPGTGFEHFKGS